LGSESSTSFSLSGAKVPGDESSRERKFLGAKVPGSESSTYGTFAPGSESTWERKFHNSLYSTHLMAAVGPPPDSAAAKPTQML